MPEVTTRESAREIEKIRIPLDHNQCESIGKRAAFLIFSGSLTHSECGHLIKQERQLRRVDYRLTRRLIDRPLPETTFRPMLWDEHLWPSSPYFGKPEVEVWAGWVLRLEEYIEKLEGKYFPVREGDVDDI